MISKQKTLEMTNNIINALDKAELFENRFRFEDDLNIEDAYFISHSIADLRQERGEKISGIKIGFTNRMMWEEYKVYAPIFAPMYVSTLHTDKTILSLSKFVQPKLEPEIFFRIKTIPRSEMSDIELLRCCSHYGHGFELVQSHFKDWIFSAPDSIVDFGCHGSYVITQEKKSLAITN